MKVKPKDSNIKGKSLHAGCIELVKGFTRSTVLAFAVLVGSSAFDDLPSEGESVQKDAQLFHRSAS